MGVIFVALNRNVLNTSGLLLLVGCESWYEAATVTAGGYGLSSGSDSCNVGS